jgi:hypothetical protein
MAQGFTRGVPIDTDPNLSLDSDLVVPSQKAVKDYIDTGLNTKQDTLTLTTTGTSGAATLIGATLNIPQYSGGGPGGDSIASLSNSSGDVSAAASAPSQLNVVATLRANLKTGSCGVTFDGQGGTISNGKTAYVQVPYAGNITAWFIVANATGNCSITVTKSTFGAFPPVTTIISPNPALSGTRIAQSPSPFSVGVAAGEYIGFTISGVLTVSWVNLTLTINKT